MENDAHATLSPHIQLGKKAKKEKQTIRFFQLNPSQGTLWKGSSSSSGWLVVWLIRNERATNGNVLMKMRKTNSERKEKHVET